MPPLTKRSNQAIEKIKIFFEDIEIKEIKHEVFIKNVTEKLKLNQLDSIILGPQKFHQSFLHGNSFCQKKKEVCECS